MRDRGSPKTFFDVSLPSEELVSSYGQMSVCRRPNCDRVATGNLGFCADHHAAYVRSRQVCAALASAAQVILGDAFALVPTAQRQTLAEYLVAVASEGMPPLPSESPRSFALLAVALLARGRPAARAADRHERARPSRRQRSTAGWSRR